jgi:hypothetical protein
MSTEPVAPESTPATPDPLLLAQAETVAMRLLLGALVWKAGGAVHLTDTDIAVVAQNYRLNVDQLPGGRRLSVTFAPPKGGSGH